MSSRLTRDDVRALGLEILRGKPDPVVRVRLLRDVLCVGEADERLRVARAALEDSIHVVSLRQQQRADGSWGRLHSRDTACAQSIPTTEWAIDRALAVGLDPAHSILALAAKYLAAVVEGRAHASDPAERNDRWPAGLQLFAAATLARIDPDCASLDPAWELWHEIARRTFASGAYNPDAEAIAHLDLTGASVRGTHLTIENRYAVSLLGSRADRMDPGVRAALYRWLWNHPQGLGYLNAPPAVFLPRDAASGFAERWLWSHEVLADLSTRAAVGPILDSLEARRRGDGFWDLGSRASFAFALPLSETWRGRNARAIDWTTRILSLISRWVSGLS
jgi:hypothetical protein